MKELSYLVWVYTDLIGFGFLKTTCASRCMKSLFTGEYNLSNVVQVDSRRVVKHLKDIWIKRMNAITKALNTCFCFIIVRIEFSDEPEACRKMGELERLWNHSVNSNAGPFRAVKLCSCKVLNASRPWTAAQISQQKQLCQSCSSS